MSASQADQRSSTQSGTTQFVPAHLQGDLSYARHREEEKLAANKPVGVVYDEQPARTEAQQIAYTCGIAALAPVIERLIAAEATIKKLLGRVEELEKASIAPGLRNVKVERR